MTRTFIATGLALSVVAVPITAGAADREHEQLMAEIRMLYEHTLRLHVMLNGFEGRLDTLAAGQVAVEDAMRRAFADQRLTTESIATATRVVREKLDETNVRLSSFAQEIEALRAAIPPMPPPVTQLLTDPETGLPIAAPPPSAGAASPALAPVAAPSAGVSPTRMYETARGDYQAGQWALAIQGFEAYIQTYPQSEMADNAAFYIGQSYFMETRYEEAVEAYEQVLLNYPDGDVVPEASYKRGLALVNLDQPERARQALELVVANYPDSSMATFAQQALDRLGRP